jgi:hypothetical protein
MDSSAGTPTLQPNVAAPSSAPERKTATTFSKMLQPQTTNGGDAASTLLNRRGMRLWSGAIDVAAMTNIDNLDKEAMIDHLVDNAVVADTHAVEILGAAQFDAAMRSGLDSQGVDGFAEAPVKFAVGQTTQCLFRTAQDLNRVGHRVRA